LEAGTYTDVMQHNQQRLIGTYLSECSTLSEREIVYEVGGPEKTGFLQGLLKKVDLPDITVKPHKDLINLSLGVAAILAAGAIGAVYIYKQR